MGIRFQGIESVYEARGGWDSRAVQGLKQWESSESPFTSHGSLLPPPLAPNTLPGGALRCERLARGTRNFQSIETSILFSSAHEQQRMKCAKELDREAKALIAKTQYRSCLWRAMVSHI